MIEFCTVVDVTPGKMRARGSLTGWSDKMHCFDNEGSAKRRRTQLANPHPNQQFAVLKTAITETGEVENEWITDVVFTVRA